MEVQCSTWPSHRHPLRNAHRHSFWRALPSVACPLPASGQFQPVCLHKKLHSCSSPVFSPCDLCAAMLGGVASSISDLCPGGAGDMCSSLLFFQAGKLKNCSWFAIRCPRRSWVRLWWVTTQHSFLVVIENEGTTIHYTPVATMLQLRSLQNFCVLIPHNALHWWCHDPTIYCTQIATCTSAATTSF